MSFTVREKPYGHTLYLYFLVNLHYTNKELWYEGVKGNWRSSSVLEMPEITNRNHEKTITFTRRVEPEKKSFVFACGKSTNVLQFGSN